MKNELLFENALKEMFSANKNKKSENHSFLLFDF